MATSCRSALNRLSLKSGGTSMQGGQLVGVLMLVVCGDHRGGRRESTYTTHALSSLLAVKGLSGLDVIASWTRACSAVWSHWSLGGALAVRIVSDKARWSRPVFRSQRRLRRSPSDSLSSSTISVVWRPMKPWQSFGSSNDRASAQRDVCYWYGITTLIAISEGPHSREDSAILVFAVTPSYFHSALLAASKSVAPRHDNS